MWFGNSVSRQAHKFSSSALSTISSDRIKQVSLQSVKMCLCVGSLNNGFGGWLGDELCSRLSGYG